MSTTTRKPRRSMQFSLRTALVISIALAVLIGFQINAARRQWDVVNLVLALNGVVSYNDHPSDVVVIKTKTDERAERSWSLATAWHELRFRVVSVELRGKAIKDDTLPRIEHLSTLTSLSLIDTDVTGVTLDRLTALDELLELRLSGCSIKDEDLRHVVRLRRLRWLDISNTNITDKGLDELMAIASLENINVVGTKITPMEMEKAQRRAPTVNIVGP